VLERKKLLEKWIEWIQQVVSGDSVGINPNGELGGYFRTHKGLRQGDPLSYLIFNLVADAQATILTKARNACMIKGLISDLVEMG
jgi:hypothetical protein